MKPIRKVYALVTPDQDRIESLRFIENTARIAVWLNSPLELLIDQSERAVIESLALRVHLIERSLELSIRNHEFNSGLDHTHMSSQNDFSFLTPDDLVCVTLASNRPSSSVSMATLVHELLEIAPCPVLLLPSLDALNSIPFQCFLVPMSGELRQSTGLALALRLAEFTETPIDLLHVTAGEICWEAETTLDRMGEGLSHEYLELIDKEIAAASPFSTPEARKHIRGFRHSDGITSSCIVNEARRSHDTLTILEWKGTLAPGRALIIKDLIASLHTPLLLIRACETEPATLKIGLHTEFDAASDQRRHKAVALPLILR